MKNKLTEELILKSKLEKARFHLLDGDSMALALSKAGISFRQTLKDEVRNHPIFKEILRTYQLRSKRKRVDVRRVVKEFPTPKVETAHILLASKRKGSFH